MSNNKSKDILELDKLPEYDYLTSLNVLKKYKLFLTHYEKHEIIKFIKIYYFGEKCKNKINAVHDYYNNYGYDDKKCRYNFIKDDHIFYRYEIKRHIGQGTFGNVAIVYDHKNKCDIALKVIRNKNVFHKQANCEIKILQDIKKQDPNNEYNVIHIKNHFTFRKHICMTFELLDKNIYHILKERKFKGFGLNKIRIYAKQILNALIFLKKINIIHCDIKPENIMVTSNTDEIKIIDFGSACYNNHTIHTYLQSRYYRAQEVIMEASYSFPIDMWSFGCFIAELYIVKPLFPGRSEMELFVYIMEVCGKPPKKLFLESKNPRRFYKDGKLITLDTKMRNRIPGTNSINNIIKSDNIYFKNFIRLCLEMHPSIRMTPSQATEHSWILDKKY